ncbi:MAG TPA: glycosyltransferase family 39 protein [Solirubrobacteraceae bacterium]|nr:glycosyltransferase family 39 protein [Solirubrobacteraceae bacterium]
MFRSRWWPLAALLILAAALRLSTLDLQSFWYDEAYVPVHALHPSLIATLRSVVHRENTPPLWYVLIWGWSRLFGTDEVALRLPSALAGIATVAFAWGIGMELTGKRAAIATAALVAFNPLFGWYSQEARAYGLFVALIALAMWCWLRADAQPTPHRLGAFAASGAAALATHYFAVFLLAPMCLWLLRPRRAGSRRTAADDWAIAAGAPPPAGAKDRRSSPPAGAFAASAAIGLVGLALIPLALAQGGHGTQWIGAWALASRLETIPQYYLTGYSGAPLGHAIELLVALEIIAAVGYGLWRVLTPRESEAALLSLGLAACGVLLPLALALLGADYLAPRNAVAAMIPLTAGITVIAAGRRTGRVGLALVGVIAVTFAALSVDVDLSPRLQRGDWRGLARAIGHPVRSRAITTVELGAAPLEYYLPPLRNLRRGTVVRVSEIDETGYAPLLTGAGQPPAPGFHLVRRRDINGMLLYRFLAPTPRVVSEAQLRAHVIAEGRPEVLVTGEKE